MMVAGLALTACGGNTSASGPGSTGQHVVGSPPGKADATAACTQFLAFQTYFASFLHGGPNAAESVTTAEAIARSADAADTASPTSYHPLAVDVNNFLAYVGGKTFSTKGSVAAPQMRTVAQVCASLQGRGLA